MKSKQPQAKKEGLTVGEMLKILRTKDPNAVLVVDGIKEFMPVVSVEDMVVWIAEDDILDAFTNELTRGKRNTGKQAVYLNSIFNKAGSL